MTKRFFALLVVLATLTTTACASSTNYADLDADALFQKGLANLESRKWTDAALAFERFVLEFPTDQRYQEARFRIGEARFGAEDYVLAAADFGRLASDYPGGPFADDAQFKVCESYAELSPRVQLDQQYTEEALVQCQVLVSYYPASEFVPRALDIIEEMTDKLALKLYNAGEYYNRRRAFDAAIMYYELTVATYPTSRHAPRALARMIDAYQVLEYDTEEAATRARLLRDYPQSPEALAKPDSAATR